MQNRFFKLKVNAWGLLSAAGTLICIITICGFLGRFNWLLDETSHFRVQYAALLLILAVAYAVGRKFKLGLVFICFALVNASVVLPYCFTGRNVGHFANSTKFRIVLINVHTENQRYALVETFIRQNAPDVLVLEEVNDLWMQHLGPLHDFLPYSCEQSQSDNFGIALFSKLPLTNALIRSFGAAGVPSVSAEVEICGRRVLLIGTHPLPPGSAANTHLRDEQLAAVAEFVMARQMPTILVGDLNTTPWSSSFREFQHKSRLADSARGFGYQPTWPTMLLPMLIPLDHCLVSSELQIINRRRGVNVGSDHFPLVVEIGIPRPANPQLDSQQPATP
jgi:endonuclease/exonuclease/phosphatase (EEP) superfamily protein YafD